MERLYNKDSIEIDTLSFFNRLKSSTIDDVSVENEMVEILESMISSLDDFSNETDSTLLLSNMFSGDTLKLNKKYISVISAPLITSPQVKITEGDNVNISGVIGVENAVHSFSDYFWRKGDNVDVQNKAFSTGGLISSLDVMLTYDIGSSIFLGKTAEEVLDECFVSAKTGVISSNSIESDSVICFSDIARTYHENGNTIDASINSIFTEHSTIENNILSSKSLSLSVSKISSLSVRDGLIVDSDRGSYFLGNTLLIQDDSKAPTKNSNISSIEYVSTYMQKHCAPSIGWRQSNLTRDGEVSSLEKEELVNAVLSNSPISEKERPIVFKDVNSVLDTIGNNILELEKCE